MRKSFTTFILCFFFFNLQVSAWSSQGHKLIVKIAKSQLNKNVIEWVDYYLKGMSWELAATWMDMVKNDSRHVGMKSWHYVYIEKDKTYVKTKEPNAINQLEFTITLLKNRNLLEMEKVSELIRVLFHLVGDVHQPLNCGYPTDKGGNDVAVKFLDKPSSLNKVWEQDLLEEKKVDMWACSRVLLGLSSKERHQIQRIEIVNWVQESRQLLPHVYNFKNGKIEQDYVNANNPIVCKQLVKAGLRLATILNKIFDSPI